MQDHGAGQAGPPRSLGPLLGRPAFWKLVFSREQTAEGVRCRQRAPLKARRDTGRIPDPAVPLTGKLSLLTEETRSPFSGQLCKHADSRNRRVGHSLQLWREEIGI